MVAFFIANLRLSDSARRQLGNKIPPAAIGELEEELNTLKSLWAVRPARRKQIADLKKFRSQLAEISDAIAGLDEWTAEEIEADAWDVQSFGRDGTPKTQMPFRDIKHALSAYIPAAERAERRLANEGPKSGPDPEWPRLIARTVQRVFARNGLPIGDGSSTAFVCVIEAVFDDLGVAKGEARTFARAIVAGKF
jgi:hypothetical protein